jgi:phosphoribosylformylglycinamidine cyclo-ligase
MTTYKQSGVDIKAGDKSSAIAYAAAKTTFASRKGLFGKPVNLEGGFSGAIDLGKFYLVTNSDGVGSKIQIAEALKKYDTIGYDLLAMVADDAVCIGAETLTITNIIDTNKVNYKIIEPLMKGLVKACKEQHVIIPGGEIAELPDILNSNYWNASAVGIVEKRKLITSSKVKPGDKIIGLKSHGFRSNGFSLIRYILKKKYGANWHKKKYTGNKTWGQAVLTPSLIYSNAILELLGRYGKPRKANIKAIAHVTGGGLPGNIKRVLGKYGANLNNLPRPHKMMLDLQELGKVSTKEAYKTWNMGVGMILVSNDFKKIEPVLKKHKIGAQVIGEVVKEGKIQICY